MNDKKASRDERELSALMRQTQLGDQQACRMLLQRVEQLTRSYVRNTLRKSGVNPEGKAEDIVQEILLGVFTKRDTYRADKLFLPWMYAIAHYKVVDAYRKSSRLTNLVDETLPATDTTESDLDVEQLLGSLPQKQRELLGLVKIEGLSVQEAADRTGHSTSDVKVSVHRALKALKKKVDHENK